MAKQIINVGTVKNDGSGDSLREGAQKINDNFSELYTALGATTGTLSIVSKLTAGDGITVSSSTGDILVRSKIATTNILGGIKVGENLTIDNDGVLSANPGSYTLPVAQAGTLGGIKIGNTLTISETGVVNVSGGLYQLPTATSSVLGGIKVGARLTITNGVLSADVQTVPVATDSISGTVKIDNSSITINGSGVISAHYTLPTASTSVLGGVKVDGTTITIANGVISSASLSSTDRLVSGDYTLLLNTNSDLTVPGTIKSAGGTSYIDIYDSNVILQSSQGFTWQFDPSGIIRTGNTFTKTSISNITTTPEIVWTATEDFVSGVKLQIQVEANEVGDSTGWHSQVCEAIIASRGYASTYGGPGGEPVMTVYGVTHTSTVPLVTFTVQRNPTTKKIEVVGTVTAAATAADLRIYSVETSTRD